MPTILESLKELVEICRWKCSPHDEVILPNGRTNHSALVDAVWAIKEAEFPYPGTPEWGEMNRNRGDLIRRKNRPEVYHLTPAEEEELEFLQRMSLARMEEKYPHNAGLLCGLDDIACRVLEAAAQQRAN